MNLTDKNFIESNLGFLILLTIAVVYLSACTPESSESNSRKSAKALNSGSSSEDKKEKKNKNDDLIEEDDLDSTDSFNKDLNKTLVVFADSIGEGTFSHTNLTKPVQSMVSMNQVWARSYISNPRSTLLSMQMFLGTGDKLPDRKERKEAFTTINSPSIVGYSCDESWCVPALLNQNGAGISEVINMSLAGDRTTDTASQIKEYDAKYKSKKADMVLYALGHNDMCSVDPSGSQTIAKLKQDYRKALLAVTDRFPKAAYLIMLPASIANLHQVGEDVVHNMIGLKATLLSLGGDVSTIPDEMNCPELREQICPITARVTQSELNSLMDDYYSAIKEVIAEVKEDHPGIYIALDSKSAKFDESHLAVDCFHPSKAGQSFIAKTIGLNYSKNKPD